MAARNVWQQVCDKKGNKEAMAARAMGEPRVLADLFNGLDADSPRVQYECEKVLRLIGETYPEAVYPRLDSYIGLLDSEDAFLRWGAILMIGNLARADKEGKIDRILDKYLSPIKGPGMITAINTLAGAAKIGRAKPHLAGKIAAAFLRIERASYQGPECRNVVLGRAIDALDQFFAHLSEQPAMLEFVRRQLTNPRVVTKKKAEQFLKRHKAKAAN